MKLLVVSSHPVPESCGAALRDRVVESSITAGHEVDLVDLYAEGFEPVMTAEQRRHYHQAVSNAEAVRDHVDRLAACDGVVFVFLTWWMGPPAMLKGWMERVVLPYEAFLMEGRPADMTPRLSRVRWLGVVTTLGSPWWYWTFVMCAPGRKIMLRALRSCCHRRCRTFWLGLHNIDSASNRQRCSFMERVDRKIASLR